MSKKLAAKAGMILGIPLPSAAPSQVALPKPDALEGGRPKTAPGSMLQFMSNQSAAMKEAESLRERVKSFEGASPVRMIPADEIRPSRWANRHSSSFEDAEYLALREEIEAAGRNVQPICVRPAAEVLNGSTVTRYEVVYGHRRHRACLDLGLPVQAMIEQVSDRDLFEAMERENRVRKNLSAWEQGCMYRRALDDGLYPSMRKLAEALKVDVSLVSKSLVLARLPAAVIEAFNSPNDIQFRWAQPLGEAIQKDPDRVLEVARMLKIDGSARTAAQVLAELTAPPEQGKATPQVLQADIAPLHLMRAGKKVVILASDGQGGYSLKIARGVLPADQTEALLAAVDGFLAKAGV